MLTLICLGCARAFEQEGTSDWSDDRKDAEVFILCPLCDGIDGTSFEQSAEGIDLTLTMFNFCGRNFYDHALAICEECHKHFTFNVLDHGMDELNLEPLNTFIVRCPVCHGREQFRLICLAEADFSIGKYRVVEYYNQTFSLRATLPPTPSVDELFPDDKSKQVIEKIYDAMEPYQPDEEALCITRRQAANALGVAPTTAARYLKRMVECGLLFEAKNGNTTYYMKMKED